MPKTNQPAYHCVANLGDASPLDHGGSFVIVDRRGIYDPQLWVWDPDAGRLYRFDIPRCRPISGEDTEVGDNPYHPEMTAWFGDEDKIGSIATSSGQYRHHLAQQFCDADPTERALAYLAAGNHFGFHEFDHCADKMQRSEARDLIDRLCEQIIVSDQWVDGLETKPTIA